MNTKIRFLTVLIFVVLLGGVIWVLENQKRSSVIKKTVYYAIRDWVDEKTEVYQKQIGQEPLLLFIVQGIARKIEFDAKDSSFYYLSLEDAAEEQRVLVKRSLFGEEVRLVRGNILDDFVLNSETRQLAYKILEVKKLNQAKKNKLDSEKQEFEVDLHYEHTLAVWVLDLETGRSRKVVELDAIEQDVDLMTFSKDGTRLFLNRLNVGSDSSGQLDVVDVANGDFLQSWKSTHKFGLLGKPVLSPDKEKYVFLAEEIQGSGSVYRIVFVSLDQGIENELLKKRSQEHRPLFDPIHWSFNSQILFYNDWSFGEDQGIWQLDLKTLKNRKILSQGRLVSVLGEGLVYKRGESYYYYEFRRASSTFLVSGEDLLYLGLGEVKF